MPYVRGMNLTDIQDRIEAARAFYRPEHVDILLVAEAPPNNLDRFFYYEDVKTHDSLFLNIVEVLFPDLKAAYLKKRRPTRIKTELLEQFLENGFFLLDVSPLPLQLNPEPLEALIPAVIARIQEIAGADTHIILIKASVYDLLFEALQTAGIGNVVNLRIPFPGSGQQTRFKAAFREALDIIGNAGGGN